MKLNLENLLASSILLISPLLDMLTGILIYQGILNEGSVGSPSQIFRFILTVFLVLNLLKNNTSKNVKLTIILFCFYVFYECILSIFHNNLYGLSIGLVYLFKILYLFLLVDFFKSYFTKEDKIEIEYLRIILLIISLNLLFTYFTGIGNNTYKWGAGIKGFFASGNGLGIFFGIAIQIYTLLTSKNNFINSIFILLCILSLTLIGSKTSLILAFTNFLILLYKIKFKWFNFSIFILFLSLYYNNAFVIFSEFYEVIIRRYQQSENFLLYLSSGRFDYVQSAFKNYLAQDLSLLRILFGSGIYISFRRFSTNSPLDVLETDIMDLFFAYGFIGASLFLFFCIRLLYKSRNNGLFIPSIFIILHSIIAGHVLFNGLSVTILALLSNLNFKK